MARAINRDRTTARWGWWYLLAWTAHAGGLAFAAAGIVMYDAWTSVWYSPPTVAQWWAQLGNNVGWFVGELTGGPVRAWAVLGPTVVGAGVIELVFVVVGWMVMSWGARPEAVRRSFGRALRRLWWVTPVLGALVLMPMACDVAMDLAGLWWRHDVSSPWWLRAAGMLPGVLAFAAPYLMIAAALMAVGWGARRWSAHCRWPALCEGCGYALAGLENRAACPECGRAGGCSSGAGSPGWRRGGPQRLADRSGRTPRRGATGGWW